MNTISSSFISNLSATCKTNAIIKEDGKNLTIFERISDFFHGKHNYEHFTAVCRKLSEVSNGEIIDLTTAKDQIEILGRIRNIQKSIKKDNVKQECDQYIQKFESNILHKECANAYSKLIFDEMIDNVKTHSKKKINNNVLNLDPIIEFFSKDQELLGNIVSNWDHFFEQTKSLKSLHSIDSKIAKKLLDKEEKILEGSNLKDVHYKKYPLLFRLHLEKVFNDLYQSETPKQIHINEITNRIINLKSLMDKHSDSPEFIQNCLEQMNQFLGNTLFNSMMELSEMKKERLLVLKDFFTIIDQHLPGVQNKKLVTDLKIKCANLPCPKERSSFPNLFLTEKDQLDILIDGFQHNEDEAVDSLIEFLANSNPSQSDISRFAKLMSKKSGLSDANRSKLSTCLDSRLKDQSPKDWDNFRDVKSFLESIFLLKPGETALIESLQRISKSKLFFQNQTELDEDMILIPHWHHSTYKRNIYGIIKSGEIQVRHQKVYRGAWVSNKREEGFGNYVLSLSNKIIQLDPNVFIGFRFEDRRWRGVQKAIPLKKDEDIDLLAVVGVPTKVDKTAQKVDKLKIIELLKEKGFPNTKVFSIKQLDFLHNEITEMLGTPNLSEHWW